MKKLAIVLLFIVVTLLSCNTEKNLILGSYNDDIQVCNDTCETNFQAYSNYLTSFYDVIETFQLTIAKNKNSEFEILDSGDTVSRDDSLRLDPVSDNFDIPRVVPYDKVLILVKDMETVVSSCEINGGCLGPLDSTRTQISNVDFGFDEKAVFITMKSSMEM